MINKLIKNYQIFNKLKMEKEGIKERKEEKQKEIKEIKALQHLEYMNDLSRQINSYKEKILKELFITVFKPHKDNKIKNYKEFKKLNLKLNRENN